MTCRKVVKQLPAYLADELPDRTRSRVEAHLKHCSLCAAELGALKRTDQLLGTLPLVKPRRDLVGAVMQHIEREQETVPAFKRFLIFLRERQSQLRYAAVNVLLLVVLALTIVRLNWVYQNRLAAQKRSAIAGQPGTVPRDGARAVMTESGEQVGGFRRLGKVYRLFVPANRPEPLVIPLTPEGIKELNAEIARARAAGADGTVVNASEARIIMRPGPDGTLFFELPRFVSDEAAEPLESEDAGE